ncbi:MAG: hypothetical protein JWM41_3521 [Gemmatimonadetes bacterium]|jgi:hypothetical protein|nr:hypothetical protein [Gemmatimonadota bacterium]
MSVAARTLLALALVASPAFAQDVRLQARLDKPTMVAVNAIVDSARHAKLPTAPLVDKALEGAAKGSEGPKIVAAVQQLSLRMGSAKRALGNTASSDEIKAAAAAIDAGVSVRDLARLRAAAGKRPVTMQLAVLSDLIGEAVPIPTATSLVVQLAKSGVKDPDLALFQRNVRSDIGRGADPTAAATTRARGLVLRTGPAPKPSE